MTITDFLLARITEDEAAARAVLPLGYSVDMGGRRNDERWYVARLSFSGTDGAARSESDVEASELFARHDPARVLAECEAKRRIVEIATDQIRLGREARGWDNWEDMANEMLRTIALPYSAHPDFDPAWSIGA